MKRRWMGLFCAACMLLPPVSAAAYELNDQLAIEVVGTGVAQYGNYSDAFEDSGDKIGDSTRGSFATDLAANFHPTETDEFQLTLSFAAGNGLNGVGGVGVAVNADDLEDDLKNINGRNRDYLLEAWYERAFLLAEDAEFEVTVGIIDASAYIDDNAFANDEISQFMNEAFVNKIRVPSYDPGTVLEFEAGNWELVGLWMNTRNGPRDEGGVEFNYFAVQAGYSVDSSWGEGNYRILFDATDKKLRDRDDPNDKISFYGFGVSIDQKLSETFGIFLRVGAGNNDPIDQDFDAIYSGGLNINGRMWKRSEDELGLGYSYLSGAGRTAGDIDYTQVAEGYVRFQLNEYSDISLDLQYVKEETIDRPDPEVWITGGRLNAYF